MQVNIGKKSYECAMSGAKSKCEDMGTPIPATSHF